MSELPPASDFALAEDVSRTINVGRVRELRRPSQCAVFVDAGDYPVSDCDYRGTARRVDRHWGGADGNRGVGDVRYTLQIRAADLEEVTARGRMVNND